MTPMALSDVARMAGGRLHGDDVAVRAVATDTRAMPAAGGALFAESKGPYGNPRGLLRALAEREIDLTAVDGWYLDLLREHDPDALAGLRTLAFTAWTPNPLLVAGPDVDAAIAGRLSDALLALHHDPACAPLLRNARVARFVRAEPGRYAALADMARAAAARGYPEIR